MQQDKGPRVVVLERKQYIEKCLHIFELVKFKKLEKDPAKTIENKMQRTLRKIKNYFDEKEYKKLYPTCLRPGLFYGTVKVYKLGKGEGLNELTM